MIFGTLRSSLVLGLLFALTTPALAFGGARVGLGPVLTAVHSGTITGWDVDQSNDYGLLSAGNGNGTQLEVFDLKTATVTKLGSFQKPFQGGNERQLVVLKILAAKLALVDDVNFNPSSFARFDTFPTVNPADNGIITGTWTPPHRQGLVVQWVADNQKTMTNAVMAIGGTGLQTLFSDVATNSFLGRVELPRGQVIEGADVVAQDTSTDRAFVPMQLFPQIPFDPFEPPSFDVYNLADGEHHILSPNVGSGAVMGIAIDSSMHMMCTTTSTDSSVEFYDLRSGTARAVNLPNGFGEGTGGGAVAVDQLHHLFIVTQPAGVLASASVYVYDERGNLKESIGGFDFSNVFAAVFANVAVNPVLRIGYATTANADQLQSFAY